MTISLSSCSRIVVHLLLDLLNSQPPGVFFKEASKKKIYECSALVSSITKDISYGLSTQSHRSLSINITKSTHLCFLTQGDMCPLEDYSCRPEDAPSIQYSFWLLINRNYALVVWGFPSRPLSIREVPYHGESVHVNGVHWMADNKHECYYGHNLCVMNEFTMTFFLLAPLTYLKFVRITCGIER